MSEQPTEPPHASTWHEMRIGCARGDCCGYPFCWCFEWLERDAEAERTQTADTRSKGTQRGAA